MGEITLRRALEDYKTVYMAYRNLAERTRVEYLNDLNDLVSFLERIGKSRVEKIDLFHLERYLAELDQKGYTGSTRKRKAIVIRSFFNFLYQGGYISNNVACQLIPAFPDNRSPRFLTQNEQERLLISCSNNPRDKAIIELFLQTGIALGELTRLRVNDIELPERLGAEQSAVGLLHVSGGRGRKSRDLPLTPEVYQLIGEYLKSRRYNQSEVLFLNKFGFPLRNRGVQKLVRKYMDKADIKDASVHTLRHTFGAYEAIKGLKLQTIQKIMGLKDIRTVSTYTLLAKEVEGDLEDINL